MNPLVPFIWVAGAIHLLIAAGNYFVPGKLRLRENLARLSPILRQVMLVHWLYILLVLILFSALCLFFAGELAGGSRLGTFLSAALAVFWSLRIVLQLFYYDAELRRQNRALDVAYLLALTYFAAVFGAAAFRVWS